MPTDVVMPQMGESIAEGTIVRWIKKVGDAVERDEPLFEISTDKVDAEIPSPVAGVVTEIRAKEGETVPVNSVVAVIGPAEGATASTNASPAAPPTTEAPRPSSASANEAEAGQTPPRTQAQVRREPVQSQRACQATRRPGRLSRPPRSRRRIRQRSSPLVRKIAKEHQRRHFADSGHRHRGTCHEERHSWVHRRSRRTRTAFTSGRWSGPAAAGRKRGSP